MLLPLPSSESGTTFFKRTDDADLFAFICNMSNQLFILHLSLVLVTGVGWTTLKGELVKELLQDPVHRLHWKFCLAHWTWSFALTFPTFYAALVEDLVTLWAHLRTENQLEANVAVEVIYMITFHFNCLVYQPLCYWIRWLRQLCSIFCLLQCKLLLYFLHF